MVVTPLLFFLLGSDFTVGFRDGCRKVMFFLLHMDAGWHGRIEVSYGNGCTGILTFDHVHVPPFLLLLCVLTLAGRRCLHRSSVAPFVDLKAKAFV